MHLVHAMLCLAANPFRSELVTHSDTDSVSKFRCATDMSHHPRSAGSLLPGSPSSSVCAQFDVRTWDPARVCRTHAQPCSLLMWRYFVQSSKSAWKRLTLARTSLSCVLKSCTLSPAFLKQGVHRAQAVDKVHVGTHRRGACLSCDACGLCAPRIHPSRCQCHVVTMLLIA